MKTFWIILLLLTAASGVYYFMPAADVTREISRVNESTPSATPPAEPVAPAPAPAVTPDTVSAHLNAALGVQTPEPQSPAPSPSDAQGAAPAGTRITTTPTPDEIVPSQAASQPSAEPAAVIGSIGGFEVAAGKVQQPNPGTLVVDDRHTIIGEGTEDKPYQITWELLTSVEQDFDPHSGRRQIPQRVAMLDGKWVSLSGWVAFPMAVQQPKELLLMLNQWDGCCIGVPPTPYDAIEVVLDNTVTGEARFTSTGAIKGRFGLKPYVVGDWLVGLYVIDQGSLTPQMFSGGES